MISGKKTYTAFNLAGWTGRRLRGIDCPEMSTKAGEEAKVFVQSYIKEAQRIVVRSSRSDKYDRYLTDMFLPGDGDKDVYLNSLLLENGHAVRMQLVPVLFKK